MPDPRGPDDLETSPSPRPADASPIVPPPPDWPSPRPPITSAEPDPVAAAQHLVGERYRLERLAGAGGMGRVFAATDTVLGRRVAIKLLSLPSAPAAPGTTTADLRRRAGLVDVPAAPRAPLDEDLRKRLVAEARAMAGLSHPNACRILEVSLDTPSPYIVMDWIDGVNLRDAWRDLPREKRLEHFVKIVRAVAAAHAAGLVHRDLKPGNILVDRRSEPIIVDFGLARSGLDSGSLFGNATQHSSAGGTPGYAAPEQFQPDQPVGPAADVYALGVILFELLTDRLPFEGSSAAELVRRASEENPPLPEGIAPNTPADLQRIALSALERDPALRYRTAQHLSRDLDRYLAGETVVARPSMLQNRFGDQVDAQIARAEEWRRLGLITPAESERLVQNLAALQRPESAWIADARRLSLSQVTLYLGGWLVVLALTWGAWQTGDLMTPTARWLIPSVATGLLLLAGSALNFFNQKRVALGYLVTACLAVPASAWLILRETGWFGASHLPSGLGQPARALSREFTTLLDLEPTEGLYNLQLLIIAATWLAASLVMRFMTTSGAFTLFAVLAAAFTWAAAWLNLDRGFPDRLAAGELGWFLVALGVLLLPLGLHWNVQEEGIAKSLGRMRAKRHDSWSVLSGAVALLTGGLAIAAACAPEIYVFRQRLELDDDPDITLRAVAFIANGVLLFGLAWMLGRDRSITRQRLATALRWLIPSHFLGSVLALEIEDAAPGWQLWLPILPAAAVFLCYASVIKQWKPFLITGLAYIATAYVRAFLRLPDESDNPDRVRLWLMLGILTLGILTMIAAWRAPAGKFRWFRSITDD